MLDEEDFKRVKNIQTSEQLRDVHQHFNLYYASDVVKMKEYQAEQRKKRIVEGEEEEEELHKEPIKRAPRSSMYAKAVEAGICDVACRFGLTAAKFGCNMKDNYQRYEVEQESVEPKELAAEKVGYCFFNIIILRVYIHHVITFVCYTL